MVGTDAPEIVALWNKQLTVPNTIWQYSSAITEEILARILKQARIVILKSDGQAKGFGIWRGNNMVGIVARDKSEFFAILKVICEDQAGQEMFLVTNGADSTEIDWCLAAGMELPTVDIGYKPLSEEACCDKTEEEICAIRTPWIRHMTGSFDQMKSCIEAYLSMVG